MTMLTRRYRTCKACGGLFTVFYSDQKEGNQVEVEEGCPHCAEFESRIEQMRADMNDVIAKDFDIIHFRSNYIAETIDELIECVRANGFLARE